MKIALDWDGTYTRDPGFWNEFIYRAKGAGHEITIVTKRFPGESEAIEPPHGIEVYYMSRRDKIYCEFRPDIWIDNNPFDITGYP